MKKRQEEKELKELMKREQYAPDIRIAGESSADSEGEVAIENDGADSEKPKVNVAFVERKARAERNKEKRLRKQERELRLAKAAKDALKNEAKLKQYKKCASIHLWSANFSIIIDNIQFIYS